MRDSRNWSSLRTFGLAFAIVLSPALMQTDATCHAAGEGHLQLLEVEVAGQDMLAFDPMQFSYDIKLPEGVESIVVRAQPFDPEASVSFNLHDACAPVAQGEFPPEGEVTIEDVPIGHSVLMVYGHAPGDWGEAAAYTILLTQPSQCL